MSDPEIDALVRAARAQRTVGDLGPCAVCGSVQSLSRVGDQSRCYEHRRGPDAIIELDHVAGLANLPGLTVPIQANAHRRVTEIRQALGTGIWPVAEGDPLLQAAHLVAGLLSYLWLIAEWLVALDAYLRRLLDENWFGDAPPFPFS